MGLGLTDNQEPKCRPLEEQRQIATLLDIANQQLALLRTQRNTLDQQKRCLMQRLLAGKLRVSTEAPPA